MVEAPLASLQFSHSRKTWLCNRIIQCIIGQSLHIYAGAHFFKYTTLSPHKLPISAQNMRGLHDFIIPVFSFQKVTYILAESWKMLHFLHTRAAIFPCCHGNIMNWRNYRTWTSSKSCKPCDEAMMKPANLSHLPTKQSVSKTLQL